jgi:hypothetical protein
MVKRNIQVELTVDVARAIKVFAASEGITMKALLLEGFALVKAKHEGRLVVKTDAA